MKDNSKPTRARRKFEAELRQADYDKKSWQAKALAIKDRPGESKKELARIQAQLDAGPEYVLVG